MGSIHVVEKGEHVPKIAASRGFEDIAKIWDRSENAELKDKKRTPCVLKPGDHLFIPDLPPFEARLATGKQHVIILKRPKVRLRVVFKNASNKPLADFDVRLKTETKTFESTLDGDGKLDEEIPVSSERCIAVFSDGDVQLFVGHLTPIDEPSGQRDRLNNLGYEAGQEDEEEEAAEGEGEEEEEEEEDDVVDEAEQLLRSAIEEFQCDQGIKVTGICDDATKAKLLEAHGV